MMRLAITLALGVSVMVAQQRTPSPSFRIHGQLHRLKTLTSVLYVAAHPDDENTRLLSWLATGRNIRTGYLSITRGDGGQNIIGSEQGAPLGLIRTHELLAARRMDGAEQFFARAIDFGYSKNPEETFRQWDESTLTRDVVRVIDAFRPDVVICRFPKDSMAGHGQHSASAILAEKAMQICMQDPALWKPKRLLFNAFRFGNRSTISEGMFKLEVGQYDPLLGMGYGELAGISRSLHKSQGAGTPQSPGVQPEFFATWLGEPPSKGLFDGIDTTWNRVGHADIGIAIDKVIASFDMLHPERSIDALLSIRRMIASVKDTFWRENKLTELDDILLSCMGVTADASVGVPTVVSGDTVQPQIRLTARAGKTVRCAQVVYPNGRVVSNVDLPHDSTRILQDVLMAVSGPVTEPYWLSQDAKGALFTIPDERMLGRPTSPPSISILLRFAFGSDTIPLSMPLSYKRLDPLKGDMIEELRVVPQASLEPLSRVIVAPDGKVSIKLRLRAYRGIKDAQLLCLSGTQTVTSVRNIGLRASTDTLITIEAILTATSNLSFVLRVGNAEFTRQVSVITYDHLPTLQYTQPAMVRVVVEPIAIRAKRIAYVAGAGEITPEFLRSIGVAVDEISDETILRTDELLTYDAVLVGIRAVNTRKSMQFLMPSLMSYVERGGTLVMSYMTTQDMSTKVLGPYPFNLGRARVTEEDAAVTLTLPNHAILNAPNALSLKDFDGWVQERGLYFAEKIDPRYETPLLMNDTNEPSNPGSLIYARYGKGHYIYSALSIFRQIPAGVPGAMKLLANMLSVGK
ncbi:MAG: PIG-L family deacetylase [Candidatus Kapabacteria bacterium]|nr:PIG-L family deacetylase [Candidatus Kapabacteria bacterium]